MPSRCSEAHRVRARELHARLGVDEDHAVADARRALVLDLVEIERERPVGDHAREPLERLEVRALELAGLAGERHRGFTGEQRDEPAGAAHRDALHAHAFLRADRVRVGLDQLAGAPATRASSGRSTSSTTVPDEVLRVVGLAGDRPHLREHHEPVALFARDRREQHQVGEREVGERAPAGHEPLEVHEVGPAEPRAQPGQVVERAHESTVRARRRSRATTRRR